MRFDNYFDSRMPDMAGIHDYIAVYH